VEKYEVNKILELYHSKDYSKKIVRYDPPCRPNKSVYWFGIYKDDDELKEFYFVRDIINKDIQNIDKGFCCAEFITFLIYEKGDFFGEHSDGEYAAPKHRQSGVLSGGYLLNDEYKGGNFIVDGKKLEVGVGELITFGREILHEITEVTDGIRYSLHFSIEKP